jgi:uncharacterized iron-regulated membrane protein
MFYRNLLLVLGVGSLVVAIVDHLVTGIDILAMFPSFLFWYLMGMATLLVVGATLADLWTRTAASLRSLEEQVRHLAESLNRVTAENREIAVTIDNQNEKVTPVVDAD